MEQKQVTLPKNVKQIGQVTGNQRVYIEDYVITYLRQLMETNKGVKISILYGYKEMVDNELYWFVNGAVEAESDFFMDKSLLNEDAWKRVNHLAQKYFPEYSVLGWAIARGSDQDVYDQMIHTQKSYFRSDQKVFFEYIIDEKQENVFIYEKNKMTLQTGYYIYYDRNECMQNYMVSLRQIERHPEEFEADRALKQYREVCTEKKDEKHRRRTTFALTCSSLLLVSVILIIGYTMLNNYEKMESMEKVLYQISGTMNRQPAKFLSKDEQSEDIVVADSTDTKQIEAAANTEPIVLEKQQPQEDVLDNEEKMLGESEYDTKDTVEKKEENSTNKDLQQKLDESMQEQSEQKNEKGQNESESVNQKKKENVQEEPEQKNEKDQNESESVNQKKKESVQEEPEQKKEKEQKEEETSYSNQNDEKKAELKKGDNDNREPVNETEGTTVVDYEKQEIQGIEESVEKKSSQTVTVSNGQTVYIVQKGDTLDRICKQYYGNLSKRDDICKINNIENKDSILYGQKLILPQ